MSRRASITSLALALLLGCRTTAAGSGPSLVTVRECVGDVVPLCGTLRIAGDGRAAYERRGLRTRTGRLRPAELEGLQKALRSANFLAFEGNDRASGSLVTIETAAGTRTFPVAALPPPVTPFVEEVHRIGKRLFGRNFGAM